MTEIKPGTPLPWAATISGDEVELHDTNLEGQFELYVYSLTDGITLSAQDARYIAHACNAYPSVITGLREARDALAALLATVGEPVEIKARPTIAELEAILASESSAIEILPSGEIRCCPSEACATARATLAHLDTLLANQEGGK